MWSCTRQLLCCGGAPDWSLCALLNCITGPDFYGKILRLSVLGLIRDEQRFSSLEALIEAIRLDVDFSTRAVDALSSGESGYRDVWVEGSLEHETPSST